MSGVEAHIQCPLPDMRHIGMVVGEKIVNMLSDTSDKEHALKFDYSSNSLSQTIGKLARPIAEQEEELWKEKDAYEACLKSEDMSEGMLQRKEEEILKTNPKMFLEVCSVGSGTVWIIS